MFGKGIKIFKLFGYEVRLDFSWLILAVLITWSLARGVFPEYFRGFSVATYWLMGVGGALGLFISIIFHEMSHSLVGRRFGVPIRGITLFIFGGVAEMSEEPKSARAELLMAIAGPLSSVVIAAVFWIVFLLTRGVWAEAVEGVLVYLAIINIILAVFNMLPAFPLDGGRVLRAILWSWKKNLRWATHLSSRIGSGFGILMIIVGVIEFITGNFLGGVWLFLIGLFLRSASQQSYQQMLVRRALEGEKVRRFMKPDPITVPPDLTIQRFVDEFVFHHYYKFYPVVSNSGSLSCISVDRVKGLPKERWSSTTVGQLAETCSEDNSISADTDAVKALSTINRTGRSRLLVVDNNHLEGVISIKDMLEFLSLKIDLEDRER